MNIENSSGTKCPKCENKQFELIEDYPTNSEYKMFYMRCSSCKTFLQALPYEDTNDMLDRIIKFLKIP